MPMKLQNAAAMSIMNRVSLNADTRKKLVFLGGILDVTAKDENASNGVTTKAMTLTDHPNPSVEPFSILENAMGKIMPPIELPETTSPSAAALFLSKYCDTAAKD